MRHNELINERGINNRFYQRHCGYIQSCVQCTERNANAIFTSEKLYKLNKLLDTIKNLTINDAKYYESNRATASDLQVDLKGNTETVTHTINGSFEKNY